MVKITNGTSIFEVTQGAFDGIYSRQGYKVMEDKEDTLGAVPEGLDKTEDEIFCEEITEKPIAQWSKDEVKRFAEINNIDISGTKNANEAKGRIRDFIAQ